MGLYLKLGMILRFLTICFNTTYMPRPPSVRCPKRLGQAILENYYVLIDQQRQTGGRFKTQVQILRVEWLGAFRQKTQKSFIRRF